MENLIDALLLETLFAAWAGPIYFEPGGDLMLRCQFMGRLRSLTR